MRAEAVVGCLLGTAVGDALGLPLESLSRRRGLRLFPHTERYQFLFGRGMFSDDTEHACMTAQALLVSGGNPARFLRSLSWRLRFWLLSLPLGTGRATLRSCVKLWLGFSPKNSGVWSAGNGPAMRAPILGICYGHDPSKLAELVLASTRLTHIDPKAYAGALAIAGAAHFSARSPAEPIPFAEYFGWLRSHLAETPSDLLDLIERARTSADAGESTEQFAEALGLQRGVSGYINHTVPVVLHAWMRHPDDFRSAVQAMIRCGGDTDSTAALAGAIVGARVGKDGIPPEWLSGLCEWPRSVRWIERLGKTLAEALAAGEARRPVPLSVFGLLARSLFFDFVVMSHVVRRMFPPY